MNFYGDEWIFNFHCQCAVTSAGISQKLIFAVVRTNKCTERSRPRMREMKTTRAASSTKSHQDIMSGT